MTYLYQKTNSCDFHDAFINMGRKDQFSYDGRQALFEYLENLAEDTGEPIELDVIALCCDYSDYANIAEYNTAYNTEHADWEAVNDETTVILIPGTDGAIVAAH